ncbi:MAG: SpoIVB peptidase [Eubacteriales bacterium]|nr:SpoIVB peptidase [Eubacteriales bacterium]
MRNLNKVRKGKVICLLSGLLVLFGILEWTILEDMIPDTLHVAADGKEGKLLSETMPCWVEEEMQEPDTIQCSAFGVIPIKDVQVDIVERQQLIPSGMPVGIYMKTEGVLIVGTGEVVDINGTTREPVGDIVQSGDYILAVNGVPVSQKEEVIQQINDAAGGNVQLNVLRKGEEIELKVPVVQTGLEEYKAGIWIRDDTQGIGTLTYMKEDGSFGALGHGISDIDTSTLLTLKSGHLYNTDILSVVKGEDGLPGELSGIIRYQNGEILGEISENTAIGIFGNVSGELQNLAYSDAMDIAYKQEIESGSAQILSAVEGEIKEYDIEIEKINLNSDDANKSMIIRVTDPELLQITGGIVQGMSGSPILQNGRIVGAVTHVFVNDPTKGYGIFIENMLEH